MILFKIQQKMKQVKLFSQSDILAIQTTPNQQHLHECIKTKGIINDTVSTLIVQLYQTTTISNFNAKQKLKAINLTLSVLKALIQGKSKQNLVTYMEGELDNLVKRNEECKLLFGQIQIQSLRQFFQQKILAYYQLYQMVLDQNPHFKFVAEEFAMVQGVEDRGLQGGTAVDVENVAALKQFLGIRAPKEEKKDAKKK